MRMCQNQPLVDNTMGPKSPRRGQSGSRLTDERISEGNLPCDEIQDFVFRHIVNVVLIGQGKNTLCGVMESDYWQTSIYGFHIFDNGQRDTVQCGYAHDDRQLAADQP